MLESLYYWYGEGRNSIQLILLIFLSDFLFAGVITLAVITRVFFENLRNEHIIIYLAYNF